MNKKQEPVAWIEYKWETWEDGLNYPVINLERFDNGNSEPLYLHTKECQECEALKQDIDTFRKINQDLINKGWQGLSEKEIKSIYLESGVILNFSDIVKIIEQKLKEKNT